MNDMPLGALVICLAGLMCLTLASSETGAQFGGSEVVFSYEEPPDTRRPPPVTRTPNLRREEPVDTRRPSRPRPVTPGPRFFDRDEPIDTPRPRPPQRRPLPFVPRGRRPLPNRNQDPNEVTESIVSPTERIDTARPDEVAFEQSDLPNQGPEVNGPVRLPEPENCTNVQCSTFPLLNCEGRNVLFSGTCCPDCITPQERTSTCNSVNCPPGEVCTVYRGRPVCCTKLKPSLNTGRRHVHRREYIGTQKVDHQDLAHLPERYIFPDNCTVVFAPKKARRRTANGDGRCNLCLPDERCEVRSRRIFYLGFTYTRRRTVCCRLNRAGCPVVAPPAVYGRCHAPGLPVPKNPNCNCTLFGSIRDVLPARRNYLANPRYRSTLFYFTLRFIATRRGPAGQKRSVEFCVCRHNHHHDDHDDTGAIRPPVQTPGRCRDV